MWPVSVIGSQGCVTEGVKLDGLASDAIDVSYYVINL